MSFVSLVKILRGAEFPMNAAITQSLKLIDYSFERKIRKIVIKPNLCYYWDCSTGQTTEPRFVSELIDLIREQISPDADIAVIESDASAMRCKFAFRMLGFEQLAKDKQVRLVNLCEEVCDSIDVHCNGKIYNLMVPSIILDADLRINISKIKYTVDPVKLTCALKNVFGCNPNPRKFKYHTDLGNFIVAINKAMKFDLCLIESNIASGVAPRKLGLVMASQDPVAIDTVAAKIAGLNPYKIPYFALAEREGVGRRAFIARGESLQAFRMLYPKPTRKMKTKGQMKKLLVHVGLGKRLGLE